MKGLVVEDNTDDADLVRASLLKSDGQPVDFEASSDTDRD